MANDDNPVNPEDQLEFIIVPLLKFIWTIELLASEGA